MTNTPLKQMQNSLEFILFTLGDEECALPLTEVREILTLPEIIPVPGLPDSIKGVTNIRGEVVTVLDTERLISGKPHDLHQKHMIVAEKEDKEVFGLLVDEASEVLRTTSQSMRAVPDLLASHPKSAYLKGVIVIGEEGEKAEGKENEKLILHLDVQKLLQDVAAAPADAAPDVLQELPVEAGPEVPLKAPESPSSEEVTNTLPTDTPSSQLSPTQS